MRLYSEYRAMARETLEGRWGEVALPTFIILAITLLCSAPSLVSPFIGLSDTSRLFMDSSMSGLTTLVSLLIVSPLEFALYNVLLTMARGISDDESPVGAMFSFFKSDWVRYVKALIRELVIIVPVSIVTLGIGGVILGYAYQMIPYLLRDYPEIGAREALRLSRELMRGHKWDLFVLQFTFIGWMILSILTAGIGFIWLMPYMATAQAHFYQDLKDTQIEEE